MTTSSTSQKRKSPTLSAQKIETYLREHPEFFVEHAELLEVIRVPHIAGHTVSLVERQLAVLREKNYSLQAQLTELIEIARDNDLLNQRLHQLTLALLGANDPGQVLKALETGLHQHFQVDRVAARCFRKCSNPAWAGLWVDRNDERLNPFADALGRGEPWCGIVDDSIQTEVLFGADADEIRSFAITPLDYAGVQGLLILGCRDVERFRPGMGLLFLRTLGEIVAARLAALRGEAKTDSEEQ